MTYLLITIIIILAIVLKLQQMRNIREQIYWIQQIVSSDGYVSDNETAKIIEFMIHKQLSTAQKEQILKEIQKITFRITPQVEKIDWNKRNGDDFEKHMVELSKRVEQNCVYSIDFWSGDKYTGGCYDRSNCDPDIRVKVQLKVKDALFSIECKWRSRFNDQDYIEIAKPYQLKHYKRYQEQWQHPVFIALGVGGSGAKPTNIYLIPLNEIESNILKKDQLTKFKRKAGNDVLFFDINTLKLS